MLSWSQNGIVVPSLKEEWVPTHENRFTLAWWGCASDEGVWQQGSQDMLFLVDVIFNAETSIHFGRIFELVPSSSAARTDFDGFIYWSGACVFVCVCGGRSLPRLSERKQGK